MSFGSFMHRLHNGKEKHSKKKNPSHGERTDVFFNLKRFLLVTQILAILSAVTTIVGIVMLPSIVSIITGMLTIIIQATVVFMYALLRKFVRIVEFHDDEIIKIKDSYILPPLPPPDKG